MNRCFELAQLGAGYVAPNPLVGAVLVYNDTIIGEGYHQQYGGPHAEVNCINNVAEANRHLISQSTLYVSLEPCAHFGKTPPCADLIVQYNIPKVVIACRDLFAKVNGLGIKKLTEAGIAITEGILAEAAREINRRFFCFHQNKRPYVILKWAQTANGFISKENYEALPITNECSNRRVHKMRSEEMAIMIGTNTALHDRPSLTTRKWHGHNPVRIFIDKHLKVDSTAPLYDSNAGVIVINELEEKQEGHIHYFKTDKGQAILPRLMQLLFEKNITSLMVEGGSSLLQSFIDANLWDEAFVFTNQQLTIPNGIAAVQLPGQTYMGSFPVSTDTIDHFKNNAALTV